MALVILGSAWARLHRRIAPEAIALRLDGDGLLLRDDRESLERAVGKYEAACSIAPSYAAARASEALALLLLSDDAAEEARPAEERFRALEEERSRAQRGRPSGWSSRQAELEARMRTALEESQPARQRSRALREQAFSLLKALTREAPADPDAARALAYYYALDGDWDRTRRVAGSADGDPWKTVALATAASRRSESASQREESIAALERVAAARPQMLRARLLLAHELAAAAKRDSAVAVLDGILAANAAHGRAKAFKAELLAPPTVAVIPVPLPPTSPPARRPGNLPRLRVDP